MKLSLLPLETCAVSELLEFELANRSFFETWINARAPQYYSSAGVAAAIESAHQDRAADKAYQYVIREAGLLLGRINLTQVKRQHFYSADLGYRVGAAHAGRGIATQAVALIVAEAFDALGIKRVQATAAPHNAASIRVLQANRFKQYGHSSRSFFIHDAWHDLLHFEAHAPLK